MSCLCIGGVCIPYTALFPVLIIALQWIASQFAKVGLLPASVAKRLGLNPAGNKKVVENENSKACEDKECCSGGKGNGSSSKSSTSSSTSRSESIATAMTAPPPPFGIEGKSKEEEKIEHVDHLERWEEIFTSCKDNSNSTSTLIVKFTADWCKPCKAIQPAYGFLAEKYAEKCKFTTLDMDGDDCDVVSTKLKVAMMPTFVCFKGGVEVGRMSGGNDWDKLGGWVTEMCS